MGHCAEGRCGAGQGKQVSGKLDARATGHVSGLKSQMSLTLLILLTPFSFGALANHDWPKSRATLNKQIIYYA